MESMDNFRDLKLRSVYRTGAQNIYDDFYKKVLPISVSYDRAVGYFSSELLSMSLKGLGGLILNGGRMRLVIGHPLSDDEYNAVNNGITLQALLADVSNRLESMLIENPDNDTRLKLLSYLIATNCLEIKFAFRRAGMYHEKIGIFKDAHGNIVVFQGSANETPHGMLQSLNAESISVYCSWNEQVFNLYGIEYLDGFSQLWDNQQVDTLTLDVPSQTYINIAKKFDFSSVDQLSAVEQEDEFEQQSSHGRDSLPRIPSHIGKKRFELYDHQKLALAKWRGNSYKGILKLATGSGKTITAIYAAAKIYQAKANANEKLLLIVAVPYIELATQWIKELKFFNIHAYECYGASEKWRKPFARQIEFLRAGAIDFLACVVVNKTLTTPNFADLIRQVDPDSIMFIGDECHNHGGESVSAALPASFYRMGLSATPFRSDGDEIDSPFPNVAKERLISYYGSPVAEYTLSDAIHDGVLTPYEYVIVPVHLTEDEQELYDELSTKIAKLFVSQSNHGGSRESRELLTQYCGQRSRLLGSAKNKLVKLNEIVASLNGGERKHTLVYAGEGYPFEKESADDIRVIDQVSNVLISNDWKASQFTGSVSSKDRKRILAAFKEETIDCLVAMKVLDEGIDVPACKTAFILASTKNPRQYVQRRGRILRKSDGKHMAKIYDFVVLPSSAGPFSERLKAAEAERVNDFALLAENKVEIEQQIETWGLKYDIDR